MSTDYLPGNWQRLDANAQSSNVAWFVDGFESPEGAEILVWQGVEEADGSYDVVSHLGNDPPDSAKYVIEVMEDEELVTEYFTSRASDALVTAYGEMISRK